MSAATQHGFAMALIDLSPGQRPLHTSLKRLSGLGRVGAAGERSGSPRGRGLSACMTPVRGERFLKSWLVRRDQEARCRANVSCATGIAAHLHLESKARL